MRIGKTIITFRRVGGPTLADEIFDAITDPDGEIRPLIAKMARSSAKDFLQTEQERLSVDLGPLLVLRQQTADIESIPAAAGRLLTFLQEEPEILSHREERDLRAVLSAAVPDMCDPTKTFEQHAAEALAQTEES